MSDKSYPLTREGVQTYLEKFPNPQAFIEDFRKKTGWTLALFRTDPKFCRFQLHSNVPDHEEPGTVKCITGKDIIDTTLICFKMKSQKKL